MTPAGRMRRLYDLLVADEPRSPDARPVRTAHRVAAAVAIAILSGAFCGLLALRDGAYPDFLFPLTGARYYLEGRNPYIEITGSPDAAPPFNAPFFYPFTSVIPALPFAALHTALASALFFGISSGLLAFFVTRDGLWRLHLFASAPFVVATTLAQYSPLIMLAGLLPAAGFLAVFKPNIGLAVVLRRPTVSTIVGCSLFVGLSLLLFPSWPLHWLATMQRDLGGAHLYEVPLLQFGGFVLALAVLAWRRTGGRLLLAMSVIPQALFFYDQLVLWLIPRTRKESVLLTGSSQIAMLLWFVLREPGESVVLSAYPYVMAFVYLPALLIVLRQWHFDHKRLDT